MAEMGIFVALPILNRGSASLAAEMPLKSVKNIHNVFFPQFFFLFLSLFFYNIFFLWWVEVDFFHDFPLILPSEFFFISIFSFRFFFSALLIQIQSFKNVCSAPMFLAVRKDEKKKYIRWLYCKTRNHSLRCIGQRMDNGWSAVFFEKESVSHVDILHAV